MSMINLILVPVISGIVLYKIPLRIAKILMLFVQGFLAVNSLSLLIGSTVAEPVFELLGGETPLLFIALRGDRMAFIFTALTIFLFSATMVYSYFEAYMNNRFLLLFMILQGMTAGLFLVDDIFTIFVLFEVSTVIATILIMFKKEARNIYDGLFYFLIQIMSMLFFIMGVAYLYRMFGILSLSEIAYRISLGVPARDLLLPFAFLMAGIGLKVGIFPIFSWVPRAYGTASAPIAAMAIQSALIIKATLFVFLRLNGLFYPILDFQAFFLAAAFVTGIAGAVKSLAQRDIKLLLAYSTISQMGLLLMGVFLQNEISYFGSMYHVLTHAFAKLLLFLGAGMIMDRYETRDIRQIRGVFKEMPLVSIASLLAVLGITGAPFFNGAASKYWLMYGSTGTFLEAAIWILNTGTMLVYMKYAFIFFEKGEGKAPEGIVLGMRAKTAILFLLGLLCFVGGIFGPQIVYGLFGMELTMGLAATLEKGMIYLLMAAGAYLLYKNLRFKTEKAVPILQSSLSFPRSIFFLLAFFVSLVAYGMMVY